MKPPTDLLVVAFDLPDHPSAGASRLRVLVGAAASTSGTRVSLLGPPGFPPDDRLASVGRFRTSPPSSTSGAFTRLRAEAVLSVETFLRVLFSGADGVCVSSPLFIPSVATALAVRLRRARLFLDIRDPYPEVFVEAGLIESGSLLHRLGRTMERMLYRTADVLTCATRGIADGIRAVPGAPTPRVVRNGFDRAHRVTPPPPSNGDLWWIGSHGNFGQFQDNRLLAELFRRLLAARADVGVQVVGRGPGLSSFTALREAWPDRVRIVDAVAQEDLPGVLDRVHLGVSIRGDDALSRHAFPVRMTDYIGHGVPVLVAPRGEASRLVERLGVGRGFEPEDVDAMFCWALGLLSDPERYRAACDRVQCHRHVFSRAQRMRVLPGLVQSWVEGNGG